MEDDAQATGAGGEEFQVHPAFKDAGRKVGLEVWRIEEFEPVRQDPSTTGKFYQGDAYIVLNTSQPKGVNKLSYDLHFWLGKQCSTDESGSAAIRAVELDNSVLNGSAVQYREVQSHESKLFLSYFKQGVRYLEGGTDSGFNKVDPSVYVKRLFQIKGKKNIRIEQVECNCGSLNQGDVFVLDDNRDLFVWVGPMATQKEQLTGVEFARSLRDDEKGGRAHIHIVEDWDTNEEFFHALGSKDKTIKAADDSDDIDNIRRDDQEILLYSIGEGTGASEYDIEEKASRPLQQDMLESQNCYVMDAGSGGIFLWTGKECSMEFKQKVWNGVLNFLDQRGYPDYISVTRVIDGGETPLFKQYFYPWEDPWHTDEEEQESNVAKQDYSGVDGVDLDDMHKTSAKVQDWMPDDASGTFTVSRIEGTDMASVREQAYGVFFAGDSYVIHYQYQVGTGTSHIIYFWQGSMSPTMSQGAAAAHAVSLDNELGGEAVQMRVVMHKEPAHFMKMFNGRIVYFMMGHVSGFRSFKEYESYNPGVVYMFQIRAYTEDSVRAIQVESRGSSLNANDIFIVYHPKRTWVWVGQYHDESEAEAAKKMIEHMYPNTGHEPEVLKEGAESARFWDALGGEEEYYTGQKKTNQGVRIDPRLYQCSMASGRFAVEEIIHFVQDDMTDEDVMILDTYDEIFVWLGANCKEYEKKEAYKTAYMYLNCDPTGRTPDNTLIIVVGQGFEPPQFTGCFPAWDINRWSEGKTFSELMKEVGQENAGISLLEDEAAKYTATHSLEDLQQNPPPDGVDVTKKEMYLSDEEFATVFEMTKNQFESLHEWKRVELRKHHGLF